MVWKEIRIKTWNELLHQFEAIKSSKIVYRGQTKSSYHLESSLKREIDLFISQKREKETIEQMLIRIESSFIKLYKSESHLYSVNNGHSDTDDLDVLSMIQHYGAPTRLLDWSYSPFISTYFAINNNFNDDSVLYALDLEYIIKSNTDKIQEYYEIFINQGSSSKIPNPIEFGRQYADQKARSELKGDSFTEEIILVAYEPSKKNIRLARQQGLFLVSSKINVNYEDIISTYKIHEGRNQDNEDVAIKFIIDKKIKLEVLKNLQLMNISNEILFPEMEGYCRGLKYKLLSNNYPVMRGECK